MHKEDLKRVAPLWLKFSKAVRHDPDVRSVPSLVISLNASPTVLRIMCPKFAGQAEWSSKLCALVML